MRSIAAGGVLAVLALLLGTGGAAHAAGLDEMLLGVPDQPYKIGDLLTADDLAELKCREIKGQSICHLGVINARNVGIVVAGGAYPRRVTSIFSHWPCDAGLCANELKATSAALALKIGRNPLPLQNGQAWRDLGARRELLVELMKPEVLSIVLSELVDSK